MRAIVATLFIAIGLTVMSRADPVEELIFEKPPYLTAAKAIAAGDTTALQKLVGEGLDVNHEGRQTHTPWGKDTVTLLIWAVLQGRLPCAELMLAAGADPNKSTAGGLTPLMMATGKSYEMVELLLVRYNADPNRVWQGGVKETALTLALSDMSLGEKRFSLADLLLKHGANLNLDLDRGETALISLSLSGNWQAVLWLLEHGANYEARDMIGSKAIGYLRDSYKANPSLPPDTGLYRDKVRDWLLAHGVAASRIDPTVPQSTPQ